MNFTLTRLKEVGRQAERGWPGYLFGGHVRTSTLVLVIAFLAVWWVYDTYRPAPQPASQVPASQVVPPGFLPDPNYTWVPKSRVQQPPATITVTPMPTTTLPPTTTPPPTTTQTTTSPPPLFQLPVLPPPFGPPPPPPPPPNVPGVAPPSPPPS